ncbi:MAG: NAD-dependent epimerase/dehydratase family protein, partial [Dehalococcoidia bacterium]|nr:NAD-dependent epimerase/dehydratase family protein [Dehalococcoidia bacterium]
MRVLITGGTGLIGRALAVDLAEDGHDVTVLSRHPAKAAGLPANVRTELWDAATSDGWGHLADGAYAIVNLAGENIATGRWTDQRKRRIR